MAVLLDVRDIVGRWKAAVQSPPTNATGKEPSLSEDEIRRQAIYGGNGSYFKITNYEAVLRDDMLLARFEPDLVILDEAQRTQNFSTKMADAVKSIPRRHAVVLTGTPLENRPEDVYSIVQFLDPQLLSPLWRFAAEHFAIPLS